VGPKNWKLIDPQPSTVPVNGNVVVVLRIHVRDSADPLRVPETGPPDVPPEFTMCALPDTPPAPSSTKFQRTVRGE
jgi:hypothetical protein